MLNEKLKHMFGNYKRRSTELPKRIQGSPGAIWSNGLLWRTVKSLGECFNEKIYVRATLANTPIEHENKPWLPKTIQGSYTSKV